MLTPACRTQQHTNTLASLVGSGIVRGGEGRAEGAALSRDTINDCDPGSSKNKDCFSIPPLFTRMNDEPWVRGAVLWY